MPRCNRVSPFGQIVAVPDRGMFMGNRGCLHDADGNIRRQFELKRWICCVLEFGGQRRPLMQPGRYTELFFLDEATALAAGHRPCRLCRPKAYKAFSDRYAAVNPEVVPNGKLTADALDQHLHRHRLGSDGQQVRYPARLADLPDGAMLVHVSRPGVPVLRWGGRVLAWSWAGYQACDRLPDCDVLVLTPRPVVAALVHGYRPVVHPSAT